MRRPAASGEHVVVAVIEFGPAFPLRYNWRAQDHAALIEHVDQAIARIQGDHGDVVELTAESMTATFQEDELAAVGSLIAIQQRMHGRLDEAAPPARAGVAAGKIFIQDFHKVELRAALGPAIGRARTLAQTAAAGAVLIDAAVVTGLAVEYVSSPAGKALGWSGHQYLSPVSEIRRSNDSPPIAFHELLWAGHPFGTADGGDADRDATYSREFTRGVVRRAHGGSGLVIERENGERLTVAGEDVLGTTPLEPGTVVYFARDGRRGTPRALDVVPLGSRLTGRVKKVFLDRGYAFVDLAGHDVFLHAEENAWPLEIGEYVRFVAAENDRGVLATRAEKTAPVWE